jgi:hypothetical protein
MDLESIRQAFRPLFGLERRETITRFLYAILISAMVIDLVMIVHRLFVGATLSSSTTLRVLIAMFVLLFLLLLVARRGHLRLATLTLVAFAWLGVTYQAWSADGVRDVAVYVYIVIIFVAALLINWQISIALSILSIISIWVFAITEAAGLRVQHVDPPLSMAVDLTAIFVILLLLIYLVIDTVRYSLEAVRSGEEKFRKVFHVSPVAIAIASLDEGRLIDANQVTPILPSVEQRSSWEAGAVMLNVNDSWTS